MLRAALVAAAAASASAFAPASVLPRATQRVAATTAPKMQLYNDGIDQGAGVTAKYIGWGSLERPTSEAFDGSWAGDVGFDPLGISNLIDVRWLREAELKHGRVCMLAFLGWITVDAGITFPGEQFEGIKSLDAHDIAVSNGSMWVLLAIVGLCEFKHLSIISPKLDGDWGDWEPGNYGVDPLKLDTPKRREIELKNGRAAMLAFSGLVTQCALGHPAPYF